ncbi:SpoIIE family protein phosphatase [Streptomyces parvulus]|uniref:SpoIIE family protein phosphatase n=1 Tax=Streptomyces parvulus TaxID=146923 RepID=UPI001E35CACD|nr:SpoIIE family protein phosphatase [Streptomyces parvulus]MCC9154763.1 SpoIIE family protein phosphatase [Streptomyces parvulus]MCE7690652.1 SpoIIE family protein phosphatase [Streptomyces parvulus]
MDRSPRRSIAGQVFLLQVGTAVLLIVTAVVLLVFQAQRDSTDDARRTSLGVAESFARAPGTATALTGPDPTAVLQPRTEGVSDSTDVDYVVVFDTEGIRLTHPDPALIGKRVVGPPGLVERVMRGEAFTRTFDTSIGPTVNADAPVRAADGRVVGGVAVGITLTNVNESAHRQLPALLGVGGASLALALGAAALVTRRLRRQTHGLGPVEITRMYEHHDAVLHTIREGVLIVDGDRLVLANDEARRLLGLPDRCEGLPLARLGLDPGIADLLAAGDTRTDEPHRAGGRLLAVSQRRLDLGGTAGGTVATLRDTTELHRERGRAERALRRLELLYDASARIGTTLDVERTAEELAEASTPSCADFVTVELLEAVRRGEEAAPGDLVMHRVVLHGVRDDAPLIPVGEAMTIRPGTPATTGLDSGHAVLIADLRAETGWQRQDPARAPAVLDYGIHSLISVPLRARGIALGVANFWRGAGSEPFTREDLSITEELASRAAVAIDNARRYHREHTVAVALQRSLLPHGLPAQSALDIAYRYLPAQAGVGGDWFDVIPLSGARVALVVGDVAGHGLHAAATMGRLRTAVHNFASLDMAPDELLGHLDELVTGLDRDRTEAGGGTEIVGATCLYVVYDPVSGDCTMARAGHPPPAVVRPDGRVDFPELPPGPPLGLGGLPFATAAFRLPEGSRLVLFTNGLVTDRDRDIETGLDLLRSRLSDGDRTPEETCAAILDALLPDRPADDIVLLVARTRAFPADRVAEWDVPHDPAAVAGVRAEATRRLTEWSLEETAFTTELILSELVTNAIRHGAAPVRVRLLLDRSLICEVSDGSSTAPHLRMAAGTDEGGRGLFLVAQCSGRWGTRYHPHGKVIWTEQPLTEAETGGR